MRAARREGGFRRELEAPRRAHGGKAAAARRRRVGRWDGRGRRPSTGTAVAEPDATAASLSSTAASAFRLGHGSVVIAAITSCTNTSNPSVMMAAGLLAKKAVERGLTRKPWVKTSLAPGSKVVTELPPRGRADALPRAARLPPRRLRLHHLHRQQRAAARADLAKAIEEGDLVAVVGALRQPQLRGAHQPRRARQLPGVAAAGGRLRARRAHRHRPARTSRSGTARDGQPVYLKDIWPTAAGGRRGHPARRCAPRCSSSSTPTSSPATSAGSAAGARGRHLRLGPGARPTSSQPPYFDGHAAEPPPVERHPRRARAGVLGDSVTTDHISPAGSIKVDEPGRQVPGRARRRRRGLQLLRRAPRQPRGDGARHLRQHAPPQPAGARDRGRLDRPPARRRADAASTTRP